MQYLARIKPTSKRETQVVDGMAFEKRRGWYGPVDDRMAARLRKLRENDLNPEVSPHVFDVMEHAQAQAIEQAEQAQAEPAGTVEAPAPPPEPPATEESSRRSHKAEDIDTDETPVAEAPKPKASSSGRRRRTK